MDTYTPTGSESQTWNADVGNAETVKGYLSGTEIILAGSGAGKIYANKNSNNMFSNTSLTTIEGMELLDTSKVTNMAYMFYNSPPPQISGCKRL